MQHTINLNLAIYDNDDYMKVVGPTDSLNNNMKLIDNHVGSVNQSLNLKADKTTVEDQILALNNNLSTTNNNLNNLQSNIAPDILNSINTHNQSIETHQDIRTDIRNVEAIARGKEGKSAYEIWLDLGGEGTEQEYLASLKGIQGLQGEQGIQGVKGDVGSQGTKGDTGADGYTPVRGTDYWTAADKAEIVSATADAIDLSSYASESFVATSITAALGDIETVLSAIVGG